MRTKMKRVLVFQVLVFQILGLRSSFSGHPLDFNLRSTDQLMSQTKILQ